MENLDTKQNTNISDRERKGWKILFWLLVSVPILGFILNPLSMSGLEALGVCLMLWGGIYLPIVRKHAVGKGEKASRAPVPLTVTINGWLFIGFGTLALPIGLSLSANTEKLGSFAVVILAGVGFMLSSLVVLVATFLVRIIRNGNPH